MQYTIKPKRSIKTILLFKYIVVYNEISDITTCNAFEEITTPK